MSALPPSDYFPSADLADEDGLIGVGGGLSPARVIDAYQHGIFPWPVDEQAPMLWWSPDPRAILELDQLHISRRLQQTCRSERFTVTMNRDFAAVIHGCATSGDRLGETWLTREMIEAYTQLHRLGHAHSIEVWENGQLAGGIYGIAIAGLFSGESMFHAIRDASKVSLVHLVEHLRDRGYALFDIQQLTDHTASLGATEIPRDEYLRRLAEALTLPVTFEQE